MKNTINIWMILALATHFACAQGYDHNWVAGMHEIPGAPGYNNCLIRFKPTGISVQETDFQMDFESTVGVISDSSGHLQFYTNGCRIAGADGETLLNGDGLNPGEIRDWVCKPPSGYICPRGAMALPMPGHPGRYVLFHMGARYDPVRKLTYGPFYHTDIDMTLNGGKGAVIAKNILLTDGDLEPFTAVRHGNGRDWWLVVPVYGAGEYRLFLLGPEGISGPFQQLVGPDMRCRRIGTSVFALNGQKFARAQNCRVVVLDFDRCAGAFSNPVILEMPDHVVGGGGAAFSPDNQRLMVSTQLQLLEANLNDADPVLDSAFAWNYQWAVSLQHMQYTPYGQILLNHMHRTKYLSLIAAPDSSGIAMDFKPQGLKLPVFSVRSLPNFPNFRLYDWSDSPCDTLGINGGPTSGLPGPPEPATALLPKLYPNPASDILVVESTFLPVQPRRLRFLDTRGRLVAEFEHPDAVRSWSVDIAAVQPGFYFVQLECADGQRYTAPLVVIR